MAGEVIAGLRELAEKATPGPYVARRIDDVEDYETGELTPVWWVEHEGWIDQDEAGQFFAEADARFYVAARALWLELVAVAEAVDALTSALADGERGEFWADLDRALQALSARLETKP